MEMLCTVIVFLVLTQFGDSQKIRLHQMRVRTSKITLSGFSSGGTMAQQLQISYSSLFSGIAVFSHTYYRCGGEASGDVDVYDTVCTKLRNRTLDQLYDPQKSVSDIQKYWKERLIENPLYLRNRKLYVYAGLNNFLFSTDMSLRILKIYEPLINNTAHIKTKVQDAALLLPSHTFGDKCTENAQTNYFIGNCGFSGALDSLQFLLDSSDVSIRKPGKNVRLEPLRTFDQKEFFVKERHDMDDTGFIYIPRGCQTVATGRGHNHQGRGTHCHLHVYFHGCLTGRELVGENHIKNSGYLEVAEENKIIMLFPNAVTSKENDIGCWDTYGFTGPLHATQRGNQVQVVNKMVRRIIGNAVLPPVDKPEQQRQTTVTISNVGWGFGGHSNIKFPDRQPLSQQRNHG